MANALRLESVYAYEDITLNENDTAELPTNLPKLLPENSGYHLKWRILKREGISSVTHVTENDNIKLEDGKIKPKAAHDASEKTQLELVAVKDGSDTYTTLPKTSLFYVTVTEAPAIELTGVIVAPTKVNLDLNATYQLSAVKEPVNAAGDLTWKSSDDTIATVDSTTGEVTAVAKGEATITVSCGSKSASCTVTVGHTHDYAGQPWLYLDPGNHYQECKANDGGFNIAAHTFSAWVNNGNGTQSRHCTVCTMANGLAYTETAPYTPPASSGGYVPTVQKPEITIIGSGKADLSADGRTATITANAGHELVSVVLNGKEMGKVEKLTGLKTGDKATITFQAKTDGKAEMDKMIAQKASKLTLMARSAKTAKKNIKVVVKGDLKAITDAGYTVKYKFYRSTKKSAGYKAMLTKKAPTYFNTYGKKGKMYYYKARVMIYDKDGKFVAQTALKQCKYANRLWTK